MEKQKSQRNAGSSNLSFSKFRRISEAISHEYELTNSGFEYRNREDITNLPPNVLINGSHDVMTNTSGRVGVRKGFKLDGQANTGSFPILGSFDWQTHYGPIQHLRSWNTTMDVRYVDPTGAVTWTPIFTGLQSPRTNFIDFWNNTNQQDYLLWVDGSAQVYEWSGGIQPLAAVSNASGCIATLATSPTASGSGYVVGDVVNITGDSGTGGQATVLSVTNQAVSTYGFDNSGTGYMAGDVITINGTGANGSGVGATIKVDTIGGGGSIATSHLVTGGAFYGVSHNWPVTGGAGSGALVNITATVNGAVGTTDSSASLALSTPGSGYSTGSGAATSGGSGSGLTVNITATATNSISIQGTTPAVELGFYNDTNSHSITINGNIFTYSHVTGMVFTGINVDPTTFGLTKNMAVIQTPIIKPNTTFTSGPGALFENDLIGNLQNRICLGSLTNNIVFFSKTNDYTNYSGSSPMVVGDGVQIITDSPPTGFITQEDTLYISAGTNLWYQVTFTVSSDLTKEQLSVKPINTSGQQAAQSQAFITKIKNTVGLLSFEPIVNTLGRVPNIFQDLTPQFTDISAPIINDMLGYDFTDGSIKFNINFLYVAIPKANVVRVYNMTNPKNQFWEAPLTMGITRFSVINGLIYGHSSSVNETYQLFTGYNDNGNPISAKAMFAFNSYEMRPVLKNFTKYYFEGYISSNTTLTLGLQYELNGTTTLFNLSGTDKRVQSLSSQASIGKVSLGKDPLGGDITISSTIALPPKFRIIETFNQVPFYEYSPSFSSNGVDQDWEILAFGPALNIATEQAVAIKN